LKNALLGVALPLLALVGFCTSAKASCGDYVMMGGHAQNSSLDKKAAKPDIPSVPHRPCSGPMCSGGPVQQPMTPSPAPTTSHHDLGLLSTKNQDITYFLIQRLAADDSQEPVSRPSFIFHPPRFFSSPSV
jgi:hypothetical protein